METLRAQLSESEARVMELLKLSEALEVKLSQCQDERRALQTEINSIRASTNKTVSNCQAEA